MTGSGDPTAAAHGDGYTDVGITALWAGFAVQSLASAYFIKACYRSRSSESRIYHYITTIVTMFCSLTYLLLALAESSGAPYGDGSFGWLHYADWVFTTPLLLVDLGMLAHMAAPEVAFICVCDVLMIASGFGAFVTTDPRGIWPLFVFSCAMFLIIVASLLAHLRALIKLHAEGAENKTFVFLSAWTIGLWNVFPVVFVLEKTHTMGADAGAVVQTVLDILAKVVFGIVLMGYRELMEGHHSFLVTATTSMVGIDPHEVAEIRARAAALEREHPGSRTDYFESVMQLHSPKPTMTVTVPAGARRSSATAPLTGGLGGYAQAGAAAVGYDLAAMAKTIRDLEAQLAASAAAAASTSGGSQQDGAGGALGPPRPSHFNMANPLTTMLAGDPGPGSGTTAAGGASSRRNSLSVQQAAVAAAAPPAAGSSGGAASRRNSGAGALPRSDTAVLTQIAIAMQNDPALAGQLRAIVNTDGGGSGNVGV